LHLIDTGIPDEACKSPVSVASFPDDWTIVWLNRFDHPFAEDASLRLFSRGCTLIAAHVHEGIMFSAAELYRNGTPLWSVTHNAQDAIHDLQTEGVLPEPFTDIRARLTAEQDQEGADKAGVDYIFDIPLETARALSGFRHDLWRYGWGEPRFTEANERETLQ
jgi:hypothetical protein